MLGTTSIFTYWILGFFMDPKVKNARRSVRGGCVDGDPLGSIILSGPWRFQHGKLSITMKKKMKSQMSTNKK